MVNLFASSDEEFDQEDIEEFRKSVVEVPLKGKSEQDLIKSYKKKKAIEETVELF